MFVHPSICLICSTSQAQESKVLRATTTWRHACGVMVSGCRADFMEEDKLQPLLDFEAQWEQELKTLKRKQATTKVEPQGQETKETETREDKDDEDKAMPMNPRELVEMDMQSPQSQQQQQGDGQEASVKEVVVTLTDEQKEWLATLPRRQCLHHTTPDCLFCFGIGQRSQTCGGCAVWLADACVCE